LSAAAARRRKKQRHMGGVAQRKPASAREARRRKLGNSNLLSLKLAAGLKMVKNINIERLEKRNGGSAQSYQKIS